MSRFRRHLFGSVPLVAVAAALACGGESLVVPPTTGTVRVTTTTSGAEPDADGYTANLDGGAEQTIGASANLQIEAVNPGTHTVELAGIAANCTVAGENPRTVSITAGETSTVAFAISCSATMGSLLVSSSTTGPSPDPDGYGVNVDGVDRGFLTATGNLTVDGLVAGDHLIGLSGVAGNCQVQGDNPRTATIIAAASVTTDFAITCTTPPANAGSLRITTATTGADLDADGYKFAVDGGSTQTIAINTSAPPVTNIAAGPHTVSLSGVAANCTVTDGLSHPVTVTAGGTTDVPFVVTCAATTGSIRVTTLTTGPNLDGAYSVTVEGAPSQSVGDATPVTINALLAGPHLVTLTGVAGNCEVENSPRSASVTAGTTTEVAFAVACTAPTSGPGSWSPRAAIPTVRQGLAGAVVQNASGQYIFYAIGGTGGTAEGNPALNQVEAYNATTNTWSGRASLPSARAWIRASAIDGSVYVPGGSDANGALTRTLYVYSPTTDAWTTKSEMPVASTFNIMDVIAGKLYVLTGSCEPCTSQRLYRYDPVIDAWTRLADPLNEHSDGAMAAIDGKLYAAWGSTSTVDMYDPATDSWTLKLTMPDEWYGPVNDFGGLFASASVNFNKKLYVIGGRSGDDAEKGTLAYDPVTNTWDRDKADMKFAREHPAVGKVKNAAGVLQIFVAGGLDTDPLVDLVRESEAYTP